MDCPISLFSKLESPDRLRLCKGVLDLIKTTSCSDWHYLKPRSCPNPKTTAADTAEMISIQFYSLICTLHSHDLLMSSDGRKLATFR